MKARFFSNRLLVTTILAMLFSGYLKGTTLPLDPVAVRIDGYSTTRIGFEETYTATFLDALNRAVVEPSGTTFVWTYSGATLVSESKTSLTVRWTSSGTRHISYTLDEFSDSYSVSVSGIPAPSSSVAIIYHCGTTEVTYTATPPPDVTWVWARTPTEPVKPADLLGTSQTVTINATEELYIRSRTASGPYTWGPTVSVGIIPVYTSAPTASSSTQSPIWSGQPVSISITNPNGIPGTTYTWTATPSANVSGVSGGSGAIIAQSPINTGSSAGTVIYRVTPTANVCVGQVYTTSVTVEPLPVVSSVSNRIALNTPLTLSTNASYTSFEWRDQHNTVIDLSVSTTVFAVGVYKVTVTKSGIGGSGTSIPFNVVSQMEGVNTNYFMSNTVLDEGITNSNFIETLPVGSVSQSIQYLDGLGRPLQTIVTQGSPSTHDIVQPTSYDPIGREQFKYLPFVIGKDGMYKDKFISKEHDDYSTATNPQPQFYQETLTVQPDTEPYSKTTFESSPLNRPLKVAGPGHDWLVNGKGVTYSYIVNVDGESNGQEKIIAWKVNNITGLPEFYTSLNSGYYPTGSLSIKSTKDEAGNEMREYNDKTGRLILKKVYATGNSADFKTGGNWAETYYIYDDFGNLAVVLPPEAVLRILNTN